MFSPLETLINKTLSLDPLFKQRLTQLSGKHIKIEIQNIIKLAIELTFHPEGIQISLPKSAEFDAIIHGPMIAFMTLALTKDPHQAAKLGLAIRGNVEVAQNVQTLVMDLDIDWEEALSKYTSDSFAHSTGQLFNKVKHYQKNVFSSFTGSLQEYLQEESRVIPSPKEAQAFYQDIENLRDWVDRIEVRIAQLEDRCLKQDKPREIS